jgi:hypothetical protein
LFPASLPLDITHSKPFQVMPPKHSMWIFRGLCERTGATLPDRQPEIINQPHYPGPVRCNTECADVSLFAER